MMNNKKIYDFLIKILLKKAEGYFYTEEQEDYEKTQNKSNNSKYQYENISIFENIDILKTKSNTIDDNIKSQNDTAKKQQVSENLVMVKKKITKHYIPPDMLAIKILFETIKEKVNDDDLNNISDDDLIKLKNKLTEELLNENKSNK